jgi:acyl-CoA dehydrogenase
VAQALQVPGDQRDRLTDGMFVPKDVEEALGRLENALELAVRAERVERTLKDAVRAGRLPRKVAPTKLVKRALELGLISQADAELLEQAAEARQDAMTVDSFTLEEYIRTEAREVTSGDGWVLYGQAARAISTG